MSGLMSCFNSGTAAKSYSPVQERNNNIDLVQTLTPTHYSQTKHKSPENLNTKYRLEYKRSSISLF